MDTADQAAKELSWAIYQASREVDQANAAELLARTVEMLTAAGVSCSPAQEASLWVRVKDDSQVWLSLITAGRSEHERRDLAEQVVDALTNAQLRLVSIRQAEDLEAAERLVRGEALFVELGTP